MMSLLTSVKTQEKPRIQIRSNTRIIKLYGTVHTSLFQNIERYRAIMTLLFNEVQWEACVFFNKNHPGSLFMYLHKKNKKNDHAYFLLFEYSRVSFFRSYKSFQLVVSFVPVLTAIKLLKIMCMFVYLFQPYYLLLGSISFWCFILRCHVTSLNIEMYISHLKQIKLTRKPCEHLCRT